jgi:ubiquinone/menaquinone biosynthesis C-methylase UbiE
MYPYISPDSRVLDIGCGPGQEMERMSNLVPKGEVVGIDLSSNMVKIAHKSISSKSITNCAFFQADVDNLPRIFNNKFDVAYSCLAHHHYPTPLKATKSILRCLRPGGIYFVIDPGTEWYNEISAPIAKWADPGWIGFHTPQQFCNLFKNAGFALAGWFEILTGFGVAMGQKSLS